MSSILTNNSAMNALTTLRGINSNLSTTQDRISSGLKVASAKDNASYFSIAKTMSSESSMNKAVNDGLTLARGSIATASLGAESMVEMTTQLKDLLSTALQDTVDKETIQESVNNLLSNMRNSISQASYNGQNLLAADSTGTTIITGVSSSYDSANKTGSVSTTEITVAATDLGTMLISAADGGTGIGSIDLTTDADGDGTPDMSVADALALASAAVAQSTSAAATLGSAEKTLEQQQEFLTNLTDKIDSGVGSLVDADMESEAARLQALQVQQQLASQALSIANSAPQNILSLFR
ncbi:flagellin [Pseudoroseicyclus aestuarii]|uniref:Flagellin n=1 Tax=Pseudoroseicyclus aestuarii TaxID=1795041 RepID=A0A318SR13_9RHOB|nr:flagellin [Pseudoroseicyclus aestuarii]PYE84381.1 flagellin [Pseudoroseicyclus aestuarii]